MLFRLIQTVLLALHAFKMWTWFRVVDWSLPSPLINVDYVQFYGRALRIDRFLTESGRIWGYDPFDMAGYVSGPFLEVGTHLLSLAAHVLAPIVGIERALLGLEVAGLALAPFLLILAIRVVGGSRYQAWAAFAFAIPVYGFIDPFSATMARVGLWGFMMASFAAPLQIALAWRWMSTGTFLSAMGAALSAAILFGLHPAALVIVALPNFLLFAVYARDIGLRRCLATVGLCAIALASNLYWLRPFVAFSEWKSDAPYFVTQGFMDLWRLVSPAGRNVFDALRVIDLAYLLAFGMFGVTALFRRDRRLGGILAAWFVWLFAAGFFGSAIPVLRELQPGRNILPLWLLCCMAAGMVTPTVILARRSRRWFAVALLALSCSLMFTEGSRAAWYFPRLTNRLPAGQQAALEYLRELPKDGRVMLECIDAAVPHFADIVPWKTGHMMFGGQHPGNFLITRAGLFSGVYRTWDGLQIKRPLAFGRPVSDFSEETLSAQLAAFSIGLVVVRTSQMREALAPFESLFEAPVRRGDYHFYRVRAGAPGWLFQGTGHVTFEFDRIRIADASPGRIVVKSHWIRTLRARPEIPVSPVFMVGDPVPFIAIDNSAGHKDIEIYNAGL